ncbi:ABC transporter ATP-binding protein [Pelotomaculum isophthalicicum JI]|uniref:ABC transporter ATP-binding protein n=1 Tax=Pelotomaculum isophthalicicum JI TaxID=947010 RepID=A0A9X4JUT1_9FIRM|nr:ABC transporter ATP-binding protein [Pelotomaculum isophthalicicum]MDF9406896.1 ABC transporter ATP-binding protein [Pelotomaculum isophthalicicum JI]
MEYAVTTHDLTRMFGSFTAVDRININIRPGEIYGFLGPNGSGKTTTMRMLCGLLEPTSGSGSVLGYDLAHESEKIKQNIGYMSQKFSLYDDLTVYENLVFYAGMYSIPYHERKKRIAEMVEMALLVGKESELPANLSGGLKQRLALGCAIMSRPSILFLDEPTSGVSPTSRRMFFKIIQKLANEGTTVMVTTHFMDEAERCHNIAFISGGSLIANDTPDNLKNKVIEGCMVEVDLPDAMDRMKDLESLPFVKECSIHGPLLHVLLDSEKNVAAFDRYTGVKARVITPSLEDVFITLAKLKRKQES